MDLTIAGVIGFLIGAMLVLVLLRPRLIEAAAVRRERDLLEVRIESERANAEDGLPNAAERQTRRAMGEQYRAKLERDARILKLAAEVLAAEADRRRQEGEGNDDDDGGAGVPARP